MTRQQMAHVALAGAVCFLILGSAMFWANKSYCSPKNSIRSLGLAIDRRDREAIAEYVDAPSLAESFRRCAVEWVRRELAKPANSDSFIDRLLNPLGEQLADGLAEVTYTPESVISMMCGEEPKDSMKRGVGKYTGQAVDSFTKDGSPKTQVCGAVGKVLICWAEGCIIDEAFKNAKAKEGEFSPNNRDIAAQYESANRYLITVTRRDTDDPALGFVFRRHGLATWKLSEIRLLPHQNRAPHSDTAPNMISAEAK